MRSMCASLVVAAVVSAALAAAQECEDGKTSCAVCGKGSSASAFDLPRFGPSGLSSRDLSTFGLVEVSASGAVTTADVSGIAGELTAPPATSVVHYGYGIGVYVALLFALMVCMPVFGVCLCCCRHCTCCIRESQCPCLRCGGAAPTPASCSTCGLGFTASTSTSNDGAPEASAAYPAWSRWFVRVCLALVIIAVAALSGAYQILGNQGLTTAMSDLVVTPPSGAAALVRGMEKPARELVISAASGPVRSLLNSSASVIRGAIDFKSMADNIDCVVNIRTLIPNTTRIRGFLSNTSGALGRVDSGLVSVFHRINDVVQAKDNITGAISGLSAAILRVELGVANVSATLGQTKRVSNEATGNLNSLVAPGTGMIPSLSSQLTTLASNQPSATVLSTTSGQVVALRDNNYAGASAAAKSSRTSLLANMGAVQTSLGQTGNQSATADLIERYNLLVEGMVANRTLSRLADALGATINATRSVPPTASVRDAGNRLTSSTSALDFSGFKVALTQVQAAISSIPKFDALISELEGVRRVTQVYPCLGNLSADVAALNASLFQLPASFGFASTVVDLVKSAVDPVISSLPNTTSQIRSAESSVQSVNISSFRGDIDRLEGQVQSSTGNVNVSGLLAEVGGVNSASQLNSSLVSKVGSLAGDLKPVNGSLIAQLRTFQSNKVALLALLSAQTALIDHYDGGFCSTGGASCKADSDCTGAATCSAIGTRRCVAAQASSCGSCPAADRCNLIDAELNALAAGLDGVRQSTPDTATTSSQLSTAQASANIDVSGLASDIDKINASISQLPLASVRSQLSSVSTQINSNFDVSSINGTIKSARTQLKSVDFSSFESQTTAIDATVSGSLDSQMPMLRGAKAFALNLDRFVVRLVPQFTARLSRPSLTAAASSAGLFGLLQTVTGVLDDAIAGFANTSTTGNATVLFPAIEANVSSSLDGIKDTVVGLTDARLYDSGSLNYIASILPGSPLGKLLSYDSPLAFRAQVDKGGVAYPGGATCLTDACLKQEVTTLNTVPLNEAIKGISGAPDIPVPVTRELAFLAPVAIPALIVLSGLFALFVTPCLTFTPRCQACPSSLFVCCTFVWAPCMLLFALVFFPLVMVFSDVCYSLPNVAVGAVSSDPTAICRLAGGSGSSSDCQLSFSLPLGSPPSTVNVSVDLLGVVQGALGSCPAQDPLAAAITSAGGQVADAMGNVTSSLIDSSIGSAFPLRPPLRRAVDGATAEIPVALRATIASLSEAASCSKVSRVLTSVTEPLCCTFLDSVFWLTMPWVFLPVILACCGCTCGLMARKRLPSSPWGESWTDALNSMGQLGGDLRDVGSTAPQLADHGGPKLVSASAASTNFASGGDDFAVSSPVRVRRDAQGSRTRVSPEH